MPLAADDQLLATFEEQLFQAALSPATVVNYLADLRAFQRWAKQAVSPGFSLANTTQADVRAYRHHLVVQLQRAPSTTNRHLMSLRKFFAFTVDRGLTPLDPTAGIGLVQKKGQANSRPLTENDVEKLLAAAQNGSRAGLVRRDVAIVQLLLHAGLRVSELVRLQKDDLLFNHPGVQLLVRADDHGDKIRLIPLPGDLCRVIDSYLQVRPHTGHPHLFLSQDGRPISSRTVQRIISDCARAAGLEGITAQAIRRTYATQLLAKTQDLALVSKRLGHQNCSITEQYLAIQE